MGTRAAIGVGAPSAEALRFGTAVARQIADNEDLREVVRALYSRDLISASMALVERAVEAGTVYGKDLTVTEADIALPGLARSFLRAIPCRSEIRVSEGGTWRIRMNAREPADLERPEMLELPLWLWETLETQAAPTFEPGSNSAAQLGAGPSMMRLD